MAKKRPQKPTKKPTASPQLSPQEPVKVAPFSISSGGEENVGSGEQEKNLDQYLKELETPKDVLPGGQAGDQPAASLPPQPGIQLDPELYRELGVYGSHLIAGTIKICVKPMKRDFKPLTADQVDKVQPSTSKLIKKLVDWAWPQLLEKHGEETLAGMAWLSVIMENLKPVEEPVKEPVREPVRGIQQTQTAPVVDPVVSTVEVV